MQSKNLLLILLIVFLSITIITQASETTWRHSGFEVSQYDINMTGHNLEKPNNLYGSAAFIVKRCTSTPTNYCAENGNDRSILYSSPNAAQVINAAISNTTGNAEIIILAPRNTSRTDEYNETIDITETIKLGYIKQPGTTLRGVGRPRLRWTGATDKDMIHVGHDGFVSGDETYVRQWYTIEGFYLDGNDIYAVSGINTSSAVTYLKIRDNEFWNFKDRAIDFGSHAQENVFTNIVEGNFFRNNLVAVSSGLNSNFNHYINNVIIYNSYGLQIGQYDDEPSYMNFIIGNDIEGNSPGTSAGYGIQLMGTRMTTITDNYMEAYIYEDDRCLLVMGSANFTVFERNYCYGSNGVKNGIYIVSGAKNTTINNNWFGDDFASAPIYNAGSNTTIGNNWVWNPGW